MYPVAAGKHPVAAEIMALVATGGILPGATGTVLPVATGDMFPVGTGNILIRVCPCRRPHV